MGLSMYSGWIFFAFFMLGALSGIIGTFIWAIVRAERGKEKGEKK
jgi:hypothetical protein